MSESMSSLFETLLKLDFCYIKRLVNKINKLVMMHRLLVVIDVIF